MKKFAVTCGIISSVACLVAGLWILSRTGLTLGEGKDGEYVWQAIGIYFIGKAFFVGPMLIVAATKKD
ncbi:MAG TPA: hypothetical protein PK821_00165 [Victivallales bacterium]|nr:hypothetical protein [Victivallales bacterium]